MTGHSLKLKASLVILPLVVSSTIASAAPTVEGNLVSFPGTDWWQIENPWPHTGIVCDAAMGRECQLENGDYKWVQFGNSAGSGFFTISTTDVDQPRFERIENTCVYDSIDDIPVGPPLSDMQLGCTLDCPVGLIAIAAEANGQHAPLFTANAEYEFDRDFFTIGIGTSSLTVVELGGWPRNRQQFEVNENSGFYQFSYTIEMAVVCAR